MVQFNFFMFDVLWKEMPCRVVKWHWRFEKSYNLIIIGSKSDDRIFTDTLQLVRYKTQHHIQEELLLLFTIPTFCQLSYIADFKYEHLKVLLTL
jgi:hypothetical protein